MMFKSFVTALLSVALYSGVTVGHPGEHHDASEIAAEIARRDIQAAHVARGLENCLSHPSYIELQERARERRFAKANVLRAKRGIPLSKPYQFEPRDLAALEKWEKLKHNETGNYDPKHLWAQYKNSSCVLAPEVTQGPYWVTGEFVRTNVAEKQKGVPIHLEYQYVDISTCKAATNLHVETWNANSSGVYSGVVAQGNGVGSADPSNINATFLRGLQPVNKHGVAAFDTLFPGHYSGRVNHIHLLVHQGGKVLKNNTFTGGHIRHVGQLFFPEKLSLAVEATKPYSLNTQNRTTLNEDSIAQGGASAKYDPLPDYAFLGDSITDGLLMWIQIGINTSATYDDVTAAAELTKNGGVALSGGMGGGGAPSGSMPSGSMPTGSMPSGSGSPPAATSSAS